MGFTGSGACSGVGRRRRRPRTLLAGWTTPTGVGAASGREPGLTRDAPAQERQNRERDDRRAPAVGGTISDSTPSGSRPPSRTPGPSRTSANEGARVCSVGCASRWPGPRSHAIPRSSLEGARTVVSAALCYYAPEPERPAGHGRLPRYTWRDRYADLREALDALGRELGGEYRVLVDANQHVDREAAARSGVGFYGKNTMLITRRHGSWVVLGTLVTTAELEPTPRALTDCGSCTLCVDACPTGALDGQGVLDATQCLSYWTQVPEPIPEGYRPLLGAQVYGCDICQDVCPWNRGVEKRRAGLRARTRGAHVDLVAWLDESDDGLAGGFDRLYVPRNDSRWLRRNALVAAGNVGEAEPRMLEALRRYAAGEDELLAEHAAWALARLEERDG